LAPVEWVKAIDLLLLNAPRNVGMSGAYMYLCCVNAANAVVMEKMKHNNHSTTVAL
jgi:hypothetical protein